MGTFSIWHWAIVAVIVLLVFGTGKLKNMGKDLGGAIKDFKKGMKEESEPASLSQAATTETDTVNAEQTKSN